MLVLLRNPASHAQGLEGRRFTRWQLYRLAAGGSRVRLSAMFCPSRLFCCGDTTANRTAARRNVPGSRLLLTHRAAMLQSGLPDVASRSLNDGAKSGSPPGGGHSTAACFQSSGFCQKAFPKMSSSFLRSLRHARNASRRDAGRSLAAILSPTRSPRAAGYTDKARFRSALDRHFS